MMRKKSPCLNCCNRELGCHSNCKDYKAFKEEHNNANEARREFLKSHNEHLSFLADQKIKRIRSHR